MNSYRILAGAVAVLALSLIYSPAFSQVSISLDIAPPPLIVEDQPPCPEDGLIWTPGYWAYDDYAGEYYWVPGVWVQPPQIGFLWTPAYWGWSGGAYAFHEGYWGPTVGFYGGINYGHGYWGRGYGGGRWDNGRFAYNTAANNVNVTYIHNTYVDRSVVRANTNRVSFNGGRGGVAAQPTARELQVAQQVQATPQQQTHFQAAQQQRTHAVKVDKALAKATPGGQPGASPQTAATPGGANPQAQKQQLTEQQKAAATPNTPAVAPQPTVNNKPENQFTGGDTQAQRKERLAEQKKAQANTPAVAPQPAVNKAENQFTGGNPQPQPKEHKVNPTIAPVNNGPAAAVNTPQRREERQHEAAPQPAAVNAQAAVNHPAPAVQREAAQAEHHAAQVHAPQHMEAQAQHAAPQPQVHVQPRAQGPAQAQVKAQGPGPGQVPGQGKKDDGH